MEFQDVVRRRRMVRDYAEVPVDPAVVDRALENATHAPSAGFSQGWAFLVLDRSDDVRRFWRATSDDVDDPGPWLAGMMRAPVVIVPCSSRTAYLERYAEPDKGRSDADALVEQWRVPYWHMDAAMASLLILQTATDAGLGGCFFGLVREPEVRREFGIPDRYDPVGVITLGHRTGSTGRAGSPSRRARTPWQDVVHRGRWRHETSPAS